MLVRQLLAGVLLTGCWTAPKQADGSEAELLAGADARIEKHRKADVLVSVVDSAGRPVSGAEVDIRQTRHAFLFGCNIFLWGRVGTVEEESLYRNRFAELMNYEGGYGIVQHRPGGSPFFSRTYSFVTELKQIAPKMKLLAKQTTDLEAEKTMQVVSDWITRFGAEFKGIVSADDSGAQIGINEAVRTAHREDIVRVSAGNSKVGMDFIQAGTLHAITYQSAESDGAIAMQLAAEWFSGKEIPGVRYLPIRIITKDTVTEYLPPQW